MMHTYQHLQMLSGVQPERELYLRMVAEVHNSGNMSFGKRTSACGLLYQIAGTAVINVDALAYTLLPGQMFYFQPQQQVRWQAQSSHYHAFKITLKGHQAAKLLQEIGINSHTIIQAPSGCSQLFKQLHTQIRDNSIGQFTPVKLAWDLLSLFEHKRESGNPVDDFQLLLDEGHYTQSIDELAKLINVNRSTLYRQFIKQKNQSPKTWLDNYRFEMAVHLLQQTAMNIELISKQCGIADPSWFTKRFRERFGLTPTDWRMR